MNIKNKKNGFTLIELIAVVVVLSIISIIVTPVVSNIIKENRQKLYNRQIDSIVESAKLWGSNNIKQLPDTDGQVIVITLGMLKNGGYAKMDLTNPINNKLFDDEKTMVSILNEHGVLKYEVIINK